MSQKQLRSLQGSEIEPYVDTVSEFRIKYFRDFPYLYSGSLDYEKDYMQGYSKEPLSLLVVLENDSKELLGISTGMPLTADSEVVKEACETFKRAGYDPDNMFYFGETIIVPEERGKGYYSRIVKLREKHAYDMGYKGVCFMAVKREDDHPQRPKDYNPIDPIFEHMGYKKTPIELTFKYPTLLPDGKVKEEEHTMVYWTKTLKENG